jgi:hypothetical protein
MQIIILRMHEFLPLAVERRFGMVVEYEATKGRTIKNRLLKYPHSPKTELPIQAP